MSDEKQGRLDWHFVGIPNRRYCKAGSLAVQFLSYRVILCDLHRSLQWSVRLLVWQPLSGGMSEYLGWLRC